MRSLKCRWKQSNTFIIKFQLLTLLPFSIPPGSQRVTGTVSDVRDASVLCSREFVSLSHILKIPFLSAISVIFLKRLHLSLCTWLFHVAAHKTANAAISLHRE